MNSTKLTLAGLLVGIAGAASPIAWDIWSDPYRLTVAVKSRTLLISRTDGIEGLRVSLAGRDVKTLYSTEISVENTGRRLIQREDIVRPLTINIGADQTILGVALKHKTPANLEYSTKLLSPAELQVDFDLLNRNEHITLSLLTETKPTKIGAAVRAKNLSQVIVQDDELLSSSNMTIPRHLFYVFPIALLLLVGIVYGGRSAFGPLRRDALHLKSKFQGTFDKHELRLFLEKNIWPALSPRKRQALEKRIEETLTSDAAAVASLLDELTYEALNRDASGLLALGAVFCMGLLMYSVIRLMLHFLLASLT